MAALCLAHISTLLLLFIPLRSRSRLSMARQYHHTDESRSRDAERKKSSLDPWALADSLEEK